MLRRDPRARAAARRKGAQGIFGGDVAVHPVEGRNRAGAVEPRAEIEVARGDDVGRDRVELYERGASTSACRRRARLRASTSPLGRCGRLEEAAEGNARLGEAGAEWLDTEPFT